MPQGLLSICFLSVKQPHVLAHSETTHWTDLSENSENTVLDKTIEIKLFNFYYKAILSPLFFFQFFYTCCLVHLELWKKNKTFGQQDESKRNKLL